MELTYSEKRLLDSLLMKEKYSLQQEIESLQNRLERGREKGEDFLSLYEIKIAGLQSDIRQIETILQKNDGNYCNEEID